MEFIGLRCHFNAKQEISWVFSSTVYEGYIYRYIFLRYLCLREHINNVPELKMVKGSSNALKQIRRIMERMWRCEFGVND